MKPNDRPKKSPFSSYQRDFDDYNKAMEEFEQPFKEFEYETNVSDRLDAEFEESMKIPELENYEKDFEQGFPASEDPGRYRRHMEMLIRSSGITPEEYYKKIHDRIRKSRRHGLSRY